MILDQHYDLIVIGGGINGVAVANAASARGLKVLLAEGGDLAGETSSAATSIIHGGVRYVPQGHIRLVMESLAEREALLHTAPHVVHPMDFTYIHQPRNIVMDPAMYLGERAVLAAYDLMAPKTKLQKTQAVNLHKHPYGAPLKDSLRHAFIYSDCKTLDSRLVVLTAMAAQSHGATILTRTACTGIEQQKDRWLARFESADGEKFVTQARAVVNTAGPWVRKFIEENGLDAPDVPGLTLIQGSHIIVNCQYEGEQAYTIPQPDGRIVFAIPYEDDYTLIGTTDEKFNGEPHGITISDKEIEYLCRAFNLVSRSPITRANIVGHYSGVRAQYDDGKKKASAVSRDYRLHVHKNTTAPIISVYGGKLTTHRALAEDVVKTILKQLGQNNVPWNRMAPLPGGDIPNADFPAFLQRQLVKYKFLPEQLVRRYARTYGTRMDHFLAGARSIGDLGGMFTRDLYEAEVRYLVQHEWARTSEDILWRRTKLKLRTSEAQQKALEAALPGLIHKVLG